MAKYDMVTDRKQLKKDLQNYKSKDASKKTSYDDRAYLENKEHENKLRFIDVNQSGNDFNARVFMTNGYGGFVTATYKIKDFREHETTLIHANAICNIVEPRNSSNNIESDDFLTRKAMSSVDNKNDVLKRVHAAKTEIYKFMKQYV